MMAFAPPLLKSLTTRTSPFWCTPLKLNPAPDFELPRVTWFWKNQKPFWASPLLSKRSIPKKISLHVDVLDVQLAFVAVVYLAANPFRSTSLPGKPPTPCCHSQLEMSRGSLEPPPVNMWPLATVWDA